MTIEANKLTVRRLLEGVFRAPEILDEIYSHDIIAHWRDETLFSNLDQFKNEFVLSMNNSFPDLIFEIEDIIAEDDTVAARLMEMGTHKGTWGNAAPTNS